MESRLQIRSLSLALAFFTLPTAAKADTGIPMLAVAWPAAWLLLIVIIPIEALAAKRILHLGFRHALLVVGKANIRSTLAGIPLAWAVMFGVEIVAGLLMVPVWLIMPKGWSPPTALNILLAPLGSAWFVPPFGTEAWAVPLAALVLCVPFYVVSVRMESKSVSDQPPEVERSKIRAWSLVANGWSYGLIALLLLIQIGFALFVAEAGHVAARR